MELGVSHAQSLSSSTPIVDSIFDKYNKNLVPIRSLSDHDIPASAHWISAFLVQNTSKFVLVSVWTMYKRSD